MKRCENVAGRVAKVSWGNLRSVANPLQNHCGVLQITAKPLQNVATIVAEPLLSVTKSLHIPLQSVAEIVATCCRELQIPVQNGCRVSRKLMGSVEDSVAKGIAVALQRGAELLQVATLLLRSVVGGCENRCKYVAIMIAKCCKTLLKVLNALSKRFKAFKGNHRLKDCRCPSNVHQENVTFGRCFDTHPNAQPAGSSPSSGRAHGQLVEHLSSSFPGI